ncbi:D-alanyl-D-alanine carboxypeptidase family protein [Paenibacillus psychroresistens]|uniref:D-alanyl-D-alanine carboxypeptidase family protein n=1 Tax=Paenibacillus psychroresistens TaxID=1778678 RepID=UPI001D054439|nr:D-alanyl-D-alanine carboxypeptidase family protein [Paenibacillus psychroresistens]
MIKWKAYKRPVAGALAVLLLGQILLFAGTAKVSAADTPGIDLKLEVKAAILIDADSGEVLYELNADAPLAPASMAKMMTEYLVMEALQTGKIKMDTMVPTSKYAASVGGSGGLLAEGDEHTVNDMFAGMSINSANDSTIALAELVGGGSEESFAGMMNDKAKELGLSSNAHFINSTGLDRSDLGEYAPKSIEGETIFTARDASILAQRLLKDHKEILAYTKIPSQKFRPKDKTPMINWNWMLEGNKDIQNFKKYAYIGMDGLKTGHTDAAGYCFTGTAERNGMRLISVVMGAAFGLPDNQVNQGKRFIETRKLMDYGFNNFEIKQIIAPKTAVESLPDVKVKKGVATKVSVVTESALSLVVKKGMTPDQIKQEAVSYDANKIVAPIKAGDPLGTLTVTYNNKKHEIKLVATEAVKKGSWIRLLFRAIGKFFSGLFKGIKNIF